MFKKGDVVKLVGFKKSYTVKVSGAGPYMNGCFSGEIISSEYLKSEYNGQVSVGVIDNDFETSVFQLVEGV